MCRLFGFRAGRASNVHRSLLLERNALMHQSQEHKDGWGIAFYPDGSAPTVRRGAGAAFADADFARVANVVSSDCVIAHVRKASVGPVRVENSHPFQRGRWLFAHNGNVTDFARHRAELESLIPPAFREGILGDTDSERCAALYFAELAARGELEDPDYPIESAADALRAVVQAVRARCDAPDEPCSLTFLVTNGRLLVACRLGRELHVSNHKPAADGQLNHFLLSSEKLSAEDVWELVPHGGVVGVDGRMRRYAAAL